MHNKHYLILFLLSTFLLTSCGREGSAIWWKTAESYERVNYIKGRCRDYGYKDGSSEMVDCVATETREMRRWVSDTLDKIGEDVGNLGKSSGNRITCQNYGWWIDKNSLFESSIKSLSLLI